jgi:hypothetical protein
MPAAYLPVTGASAPAASGSPDLPLHDAPGRAAANSTMLPHHPFYLL